MLNSSIGYDPNKTICSLPAKHSMIRSVKSPSSKMAPKKSTSITNKQMVKSNSNSKLLTAQITPRALRSLSKVSKTSDGFSKTKLKTIKLKLPEKY